VVKKESVWEARRAQKWQSGALETRGGYEASPVNGKSWAPSRARHVGGGGGDWRRGDGHGSGDSLDITSGRPKI